MDLSGSTLAFNSGQNAMNTRLSGRILCVAAAASLLAATSLERTAAQVRPGPPHEQRPAIQPVYDGWYKNADGTLTFSYGYINRTARLSKRCQSG